MSRLYHEDEDNDDDDEDDDKYDDKYSFRKLRIGVLNYEDGFG